MFNLALTAALHSARGPIFRAVADKYTNQYYNADIKNKFRPNESPVYSRDYNDNSHYKGHRNRQPRAATPPSSLLGNLLRVISDLARSQRQVGSYFLGGGLILMFIGMMLFFESNLLRLGNIMAIMGATLLIGPDKLGSFFLQKSRLQATIIIGLGVLLLLTGSPRLGLLVEIFGLLNLFGNMLPFLLFVLKGIPGVGELIGLLDGSSTAAAGGRRNGMRGGGGGGGLFGLGGMFGNSNRDYNGQGRRENDEDGYYSSQYDDSGDGRGGGGGYYMSGRGGGPNSEF